MARAPIKRAAGILSSVVGAFNKSFGLRLLVGVLLRFTYDLRFKVGFIYTAVVEGAAVGVLIIDIGRMVEVFHSLAAGEFFSVSLGIQQ